jgi:hypothetical protein
MRRARLALPLGLATLLACQPAADPSTAPNRVSAGTPVRSLGATVQHSPRDYFLIYDSDPDRDYTTTFGLVSPVSDLNSCGGTGPEVYDGGGITRIVATPSGDVRIRDQLQQATIVFYEGATEDVCALAAHRVLGRGRGNLHWNVKFGVNGSLSIQATFGGILDLTAGGRARMLGVGNVVLDRFGNLTIHEDHFDLKPIGH